MKKIVTRIRAVSPGRAGAAAGVESIMEPSRF
jgi:hypothetical protein